MKMKPEEFVLNSPTSIRKSYMVNSTILRDHVEGKKNRTKTNIFGESFNAFGLKSNMSSDLSVPLHVPSYSKKLRKSIFQ